MRIIDRPAKFVRRRDALYFRHRRRWHRVQCVTEVWRESGEWWRGEPGRFCLRLQTSDGTFAEFYREEGGDRGKGFRGERPEKKAPWVLYKIFD